MLISPAELAPRWCEWSLNAQPWLMFAARPLIFAGSHTEV
jgi:hypothetical protein